MGTELGQLVYTLTLNDAGFQSELTAAKDKVVSSNEQMQASNEETAATSSKLGGAFSGMAGQFIAGAALFTIGQKVLSGLNNTLHDGVKSFEQWQQNQAQLNNSLETTGDASGQTINSLNKYAEALSAQTGISGNAVNAAQLVMLNYKEIGKDVFPEATKQVANFATVLSHGAVPSQDQMTTAAKLLGRALEDPTKGATALTRAGVTLSHAQQDQIKTMAKAGDIAGAQKLLLGDLADVVGGKATTASKTLAGEQAKLHAALEKIEISVGQKLTAAFHALEPVLASVLGFLADHKVVLAAVAAVVVALAIGIGIALVAALWSAIAAMGVFAIVSTLAFWEVVVAAAVIGAIAYEIITHWSDLKQWFWDFVHDVGGFFHTLWEGVDKVWQVWLKTQETGLNFIKRIFEDVFNFIKRVVTDVIHATTTVLRPFYEYYKFIFETMYAIARYVWHLIYNDVIRPVVGFIIDLYHEWLRINEEILHAIFNTAKAVWNAIYNDVIRPVNDFIIMSLTVVWHTIDGIWQAIWGAVAPVFTAIGHAARDAWNFIVGVWQGAVAWFEGLFKGVSKAGGDAANSVGKFFSQIWSDIKNDAKTAINFVIGLINDLIKAYNSTVGSVPGAPKIANVPKFASGVNNFGGGLALVGENGPELANLPAGTSIHSNSESKTMMGNHYNFSPGSIVLSTAEAVDEFFNIGNRNTQLEGGGISPLAGTTRV